METNTTTYSPMKGLVRLGRMKFFAYHGVSEQERIVGNEFQVDLEYEFDVTMAVETDDVANTISYADIYAVVHEEMSIPSNLLEAVAGRILRHLYIKFPTLLGARIELAKMNPPIGADINYALVAIGNGTLA